MMSGALRRCPASLLRPVFTRNPSINQRLAASWSRSGSILLRPTAASAISLFHSGRQLHQTVAAAAEHSAPDAIPPFSTQANEPVTKFEDLETRGLVHPNVVSTITKYMNLDTMTEVQSRTINEALKGADIIAQAKTGTGKTIGFLLPILQNIIKEDPSLAIKDRYHRASASDIRAIVISPTRELAEQIAEEARRLTSRTNVIVQTAVGGTQKSYGLRMIQQRGCHLLVATPGRLNDILSDEYSGVSAPKLSALVLDEADRLLDAGFERELNSIMRQLPDPRDRERQTLMFSATVPQEVVHLVRRTLKPGFHFVNCVSADEQPTHEKVKQKVVEVAGIENLLPSLFELCEKEIRASSQGDSRPFKAIVFFNSTAEVTLASAVFRELQSRAGRRPLDPARLYEIHGKLTQQQRTNASERFRNSQSAILFSSDVTARGLDFPNVTHVIQVGLPRSTEDYIHRIGRTARAGKEGQGWLLHSPLEAHEVRRRLRGLPIEPDSSLATAKVDMTQDARIPEAAAKILTEIVEAHKRVDVAAKKMVYLASLGIYTWHPDKQGVIDAMKNLALYGWGMDELPRVRRSLTSKLGYTKVSGINYQDEGEMPQRSRRFGASRGDAGANPFDDRGMQDFPPRRESRRSSGFGSNSFGGSHGRYSEIQEQRNFGDRSFRDRSNSYGQDRRGRSRSRF